MPAAKSAPLGFEDSSRLLHAAPAFSKRLQVVERPQQQGDVNAFRRHPFQIRAGHLMAARDLPVKASLAQLILNRVQQARRDIHEVQMAASAREKFRVVAASDADLRHDVACPRHTRQPSKRHPHLHGAIPRQP
jgi:hypothetical protein